MEDDEYFNIEELDLRPQRRRIEEKIALQKPLKEIHWNKRGENNLQGFYGNGLCVTLKRKKNVTKTLKKKAFKCCNIGAL